MKKICFIGFSLFSIGGCQRVTISLANDLCSRYNVHILSLCEIPNPNNYYVDGRVKVHSLGMPSDLRARGSIGLFFKIKKFLEENKIDILFLAGSLPIPVISLLRPFLKLKVVFCDHENLSGRDKKSVFFRKVACMISDRVVVLTKQTLEEYIKVMNIKKSKIIQIYNYIDDKLLNNKNEYNIESNKIISVGRLSSEKGFDMALKVARLVFDKYPDWQWHIYGDGPEKNNLTQSIKELNLENNFILKGSTPKVITRYKDYSMLVLPSYREGFALVLIEAKSCGLPVISFDCNSGPSEIIDNNKNGYLIPCYDINNMAEKICKLIENTSIREKFSSCARKDLGKFSKNNILNSWKNLIDNI